MEFQKENLFERLKIFNFFSGLTDSEIIKIVNSSSVRFFRKDMYVFYQGDKVEAVYFILSGRVKIIKYRADETSVILNRLGKGRWLGLAENIAEGPYLTDALAEEKSELLCISRSNFKRLLNLPGFNKTVLNILSADYYSLHSNLETYSPLQKIIQYLKAYILTFKDYNDETKSIVIDITQEDLAESIGFTRETVNKYLNDLQKKNIISISRGKIEVLDVKILKEFLTY